MKNMDDDGNGTVDFAEFCVWFKHETERQEAEDAPLKAEFESYDLDKDGFISKEELGIAFGTEGIYRLVTLFFRLLMALP